MGKSFSSLFFSLPGRYASALLNSSNQSFEQDFKVTLRAIGYDASTELLLNSPYLSKKHVIDFMDVMRDKLGLQKEFTNFLKLLVLKNRFNILRDVYRCYVTLWNGLHNIKSIHVVSSDVLKKEQEKGIEELLAQFFDEKLLIDFSVDPSILGGILIKTDDLRIDATVLSQIQSLNSLLSAA
ncbi:MAG: ATP synthase F1 subunit delta [Proteobacteria bacterium]|nr:ATP synthase F1 subunit delta [Pseudomonadota bacterium]